MSDAAERVLGRVEALLTRLEAVLPGASAVAEPDWGASVAFRYRRRGSAPGRLDPVRLVAPLQLTDVCEVEAQKEKIVRNTQQFLAGRTLLGTKPVNSVKRTPTSPRSKNWR
jgi:predicted AAA+ superfamily ATPase